MRPILVDGEVYDRLKKLAEPFVDSPNDVLRRVFELEPKRSTDDEEGVFATNPSEVNTAFRGRATRAGVTFTDVRVNRTPDRDFRVPILQALQELGGRAATGDVLKRVRRIIEPALKPVDFDEMRSGQVRWRSATNFEKKHMALEAIPLVNPNSPRGIWEITDAGRQYLQEVQKSQ